MKRHRWTLWALVVGLLVLFLVQFRYSAGFEWKKFWQYAQHADAKHLVLALGLIYFSYAMRAIRWAILLRPTKNVKAASLLGTQIIGFTAIALFGRLGELVRPYLVARRVKLPLASQLAVYTVERMFDVGSVALIFSATLALSPSLNVLPFHAAFHKIGYAGLILAAGIGLLAWLLHASGDLVAIAVGRTLRLLSQSMGDWATVKLLAFRDGFRAISSIRELVSALVVSLGLWAVIAYSYVEVTHSFVNDSVLSSLPFSHCMLLLAASVVGSVAQLPMIGGGSQVATAGAMKMLFGVAIEPAVACAIMLWLITFAGVIPAGLIWARIEHVSINRIATRKRLDTEEEVEIR